jgi:hypothetical protein
MFDQTGRRHTIRKHLRFSKFEPFKHFCWHYVYLPFNSMKLFVFFTHRLRACSCRLQLSPSNYKWLGRASTSYPCCSLNSDIWFSVNHHQPGSSPHSSQPCREGIASTRNRFANTQRRSLHLRSQTLKTLRTSERSRRSLCIL